MQDPFIPGKSKKISPHKAYETGNMPGLSPPDFQVFMRARGAIFGQRTGQRLVFVRTGSRAAAPMAVCQGSAVGKNQK